MSSFESLGLYPQIFQAITEAGYTQPTPVQLEAIPLAMQEKDICVSAHTGTGKTAAFLLPALHRLMTRPAAKGAGPRLLILVPTRELAAQVAVQAKIYSKYLPHIKTLCMIGGVPYHMQRKIMQNPYDILIATPGRLIDYLESGKLTLSRVEMLVLDEADRMLDMGFIEAVEHIAQAIPTSRQTLLFSATLSTHIMTLSKNLMKEPQKLFVETEKDEKKHIEQRLHYTDDLDHKHRLLEHILGTPEVTRAIVFTSTKQHAGELVDQLNEYGHLAAALHGDMHQRQRNRTIAQLRNGEIRILVATDVAARGIDVPAITHVINFDLPRNIEDYVHRIGRTGRAGAKGVALSFAGHRDAGLVQRIEKFTGQPIASHEIPGFEPRKKQVRSGEKRYERERPTPRSFGKPRAYAASPKPPSSGGNFFERRATKPGAPRGKPNYARPTTKWGTKSPRVLNNPRPQRSED